MEFRVAEPVALSVGARALEDNPLGRIVLFRQARKAQAKLAQIYQL